MKRRKANDDDHTKDLDEIGSVRMRYPEVVSTITAEGRVLKWCDTPGAFVVLTVTGQRSRCGKWAHWDWF